MTQRVQCIIVAFILCGLLGTALPPAGVLYAQTNTAQVNDGTKVYLPLIAAPPGAPDFVITSPTEGLTVSGVSFFAVQPVDASNVSKVSFQAGATNLGTDTNGVDGFQVFLDASQLPAGPVQLTATAIGPTGLTQKRSLHVTLVPKAPASASVGASGATLGTASGNTIVVPPGAVNAGTTISVQDKTQEQVTQEKGINWDAMGVTFLGAIDVQASGSISKPLGVSSVGFGNRIQPGQAVVTYRILPDADGDGVGELVVVNGANLAPNGTIVSSPVAQIVVNSISIDTGANATQIVAAESALHGLPGKLITIHGNGFNPLSVQGNLAVFHSLQNGATLSVPADVEQNTLDQTIRVLMPALTPGNGTLMLHNESTGATAGPFNIVVDEPAPLNQPASQIVDTFFSQSLSFVAALPTETEQKLANQNSIINSLTQLRTSFQALSNDSSPEAQQLIRELATTIEGSGVQDSLKQVNAATPFALDGCFTPHQKNTLNLIVGVLGVIGAGGCAAAFTGGGAIVCGVAIGLLAVIDQYLISETPDCPATPPMCTAASTASGPGTTGMGAAPPPGGNGCGNASGGGGSKVQASGLTSLTPGRYIVKVFPQAGGRALTPFTGATDPGGYFFIPLIPQGEPFKAVATDQTTGAAVSTEGIGPATGKSVMMFFDFSNAQQNLYNIAIGDTISNGMPAAGAGNIEVSGGLDVYTFQATPGQQIYVDTLSKADDLNGVTWELTDSTNAKLFSTCLGCGEPGLLTLPQGGLYTLRVGVGNHPGTGVYSFKLWNVPAPERFNITIGDTISNGVPGPGAGNIETPGIRDIYTFQAAAGQQIYVNLLSHAPGTTFVDWRLEDSTGTKLFDTCLGCGEPGVVTLVQGGVYTLTLGTDRDPDNGIYSFKLWNVPPPQGFNIAIDDTVADGAPSAGAGNIETPGVRDIYTFNAAAGQQIYVNLLSHAPGTTFVDWRLEDSTGTKLFDTCLGCGEPGVVTLARGGVYTLTLGANRDPDNGIYSFKLWNVPSPQHFAITIGDTVSSDVPSAGAGNIETPGVKDIYTFNAAPGQKVQVALLSHAAGTTFVDWRLEDSTGTKLFDTCFGCGAPAVVTLAQGGVYTLTVGTDGDPDVGTYQFQITAQ